MRHKITHCCVPDPFIANFYQQARFDVHPTPHETQFSTKQPPTSHWYRTVGAMKPVLHLVAHLFTAVENVVNRTIDWAGCREDQPCVHWSSPMSNVPDRVLHNFSTMGMSHAPRPVNNVACSMCAGCCALCTRQGMDGDVRDSSGAKCRSVNVPASRTRKQIWVRGPFIRSPPHTC